EHGGDWWVLAVVWAAVARSRLLLEGRGPGVLDSLPALSCSLRTFPGPLGYFFLPPFGFPASLRLARHVPSLLRERGWVPPPSSLTYGPLPARRSAMVASLRRIPSCSGPRLS